jgi:hypothetical protein
VRAWRVVLAGSSYGEPAAKFSTVLMSSGLRV